MTENFPAVNREKFFHVLTFIRILFEGGFVPQTQQLLSAYRRFISLIIILLIRDYTVTPGVFIVKGLIGF